MVALFQNLLGGTVTDDPLSSGATTINSAAFANLPVVSGGDTMWLTLDPEAENGAPEIVQVTAHTAGATSVTVVRAQQDTSARSHPETTRWVHALTDVDVDGFLTAADVTEFLTVVTVDDLNAALEARLPQAGDLKWTLSTVETSAWINHNQAVADCDSTYPALWAAAPASWKSGTTLTIPDLSDVAMIGAGSVAALGAVGGSNTQTLTEANLAAHDHSSPAHTHTINHGHGNSFSATSSGGSHNHTQNPHGHSITNGTQVVRRDGTGNAQLVAGTGAYGPYNTYFQSATDETATNITSPSHSHTIAVSGAVTDHSGSSGAASGDANTGSAGSGTAFSTVHASLGVNVQVLAY